MRIAFLISTMSYGGAERVAAILSNQWAADGHHVHLVTFEPEGAASAYPIAAQVESHQLNLIAQSGSPIASCARSWRRIRSIRRCLQRIEPEVVVAFMTETNLLAILASWAERWSLVISERIHPGYHPVGPLREVLRRLVYPYASAVVVQTPDVAQWLKARTRVDSDVIANPVDLVAFNRYRCARSAEVRRDGRRLTAVGRLVPQKGYDVLIRAFAKVAQSHPGWMLTIYGDGSEREALERLVASHELGSRVELPGVTSDIPSVLVATDIFVLTSRYEGYPNSLVEALAAGCTVVASDCPGGVRALLGDGRYGALVPVGDVDSLAKTLAHMMNDEARRAVCTAIARDAVAHLDSRVIAKQWLDLFARIRKQRSMS